MAEKAQTPLRHAFEQLASRMLAIAEKPRFRLRKPDQSRLQQPDLLTDRRQQPLIGREVFQNEPNHLLAQQPPQVVPSDHRQFSHRGLIV